MSAPEPFVDIAAAARFLGVRVSYLYEEVRLGRVPSFKLGKFRRFRLSELEAWALARQQGPDRPLVGAARGQASSPEDPGTCEPAVSTSQRGATS